MSGRPRRRSEPPGNLPVGTPGHPKNPLQALCRPSEGALSSQRGPQATNSALPRANGATGSLAPDSEPVLLSQSGPSLRSSPPRASFSEGRFFRQGGGVERGTVVLKGLRALTESRQERRRVRQRCYSGTFRLSDGPGRLTSRGTCDKVAPVGYDAFLYLGSGD